MIDTAGNHLTSKFFSSLCRKSFAYTVWLIPVNIWQFVCKSDIHFQHVFSFSVSFPVWITLICGRVKLLQFNPGWIPLDETRRTKPAGRNLPDETRRTKPAGQISQSNSAVNQVHSFQSNNVCTFELPLLWRLKPRHKNILKLFCQTVLVFPVMS